MTIKQRLLWTLLTMTGLLALIGYLGLRTAVSIQEDFELVSEQTLPMILVLQDHRAGVMRALSSSAEYAFVMANMEASGEAEEAGKEELLLIDQGKALCKENLERYMEFVALFPGEQKMARELQAGTDALILGIEEFVELSKGKTPAVELLEQKERLEALEQTYVASFQHVLEHESHELEGRRENVLATIVTGRTRVAWTAIFGLVVASALAVHLLLLLSRSLQKLKEGAEKFGSGDLEWKIDLEPNHELAALGKAMENMAVDLQRSIFLDELLQSMLDGLLVISPDATIGLVNRGLSELLGREEKELLGTPAKTLFADPRFSSGSRIDSLLQAGLIGHQTSSFVAQDGEEIPVSLSSSILLTGGTIEGIVCVAQDLRGKLRLQKEILRQRNLLEGTLASIGDAVIATDPTAKVTFLNPVAEEMTGWSLQEAAGRDIGDIFPISDELTGAVVQNPVHQVLEKGVIVGLANHNVLTRRDNTRVPIDDSAAPIRGKDGELSGVILVFRDVTERRQKDRDLVAAKLAADRANQSKSGFLAMMSHEMRTPLNGIVGVSRLLLDSSSLSAQERDYAETIRLSGDTLMALIEEVLDFSKIETGTIDLELKAFNLPQCVEEALDIVAPRSLEKDLELHYQLDPELPEVIVGDANRLRQVLINLVGNAIKFTARGEISVWITAYHGEGPETLETSSKKKLLFAVNDTGVGIPPEATERVFDAFEQVDSSRTRKYGGSGLGLTISKRLVELMGGSIWFKSGVHRSGGGSTFFFTIALETPLTSSCQGKPRQQVLAGKRVLIVSGSATQLSVLSSLCLSRHMLPSITPTGSEALVLLKRQPTDIAIIDLETVGMESASLCNEIHPLAPIIALARPSEDATKINLEGWVSDRIFKPIKQSALMNAITQVLEYRAEIDERPEPMPLGVDSILADRLPLRILVAEDDPVNRKVADAILRRIGYEADFVDDGSKAVEAVRTKRYEVILMDVRMPEMDGLETTRKIIEILDQVDRPKIIALTASALEEDRKQCLAAGMDDYITKPVTLDVVRKKLSQWCSSGESVDPPADAPAD